MNIQSIPLKVSICNKNSFINSNISNSQECTAVRNNYSPSFTSLLPTKLFEHKTEKILKKLKDFSIDEYNTLSNDEKNILRLRYKIHFLPFQHQNIGYGKKIYNSSPKYIKKFANSAEIIHSGAADEIKESLDNIYGEGKYTVVTIGRSVSSIGKVLGYKLGEDSVLNIPMSSASRFMSEKNRKCENLDFLKKFLDEKGINKKMLSNPDMQIVLVDYSNRGYSLEGALDLFQKELYPQYKDRISAESVVPLISNPNLRAHVDNNLTYSTFKNFSFVGKCENMSNIYSALNCLSDKKEFDKLFLFKLLDDFMTGKRYNLSELDDITNKSIFHHL